MIMMLRSYFIDSHAASIVHDNSRACRNIFTWQPIHTQHSCAQIIFPMPRLFVCALAFLRPAYLPFTLRGVVPVDVVDDANTPEHENPRHLRRLCRPPVHSVAHIRTEPTDDRNGRNISPTDMLLWSSLVPNHSHRRRRRTASQCSPVRQHTQHRMRSRPTQMISSPACRPLGRRMCVTLAPLANTFHSFTHIHSFIRMAKRAANQPHATAHMDSVCTRRS